MKISCPVSLGELVDKLSILIIKKKMIKDIEKLKHVENEFRKLDKVLSELKLPEIDSYVEKLVEVNTRLWNIEDAIRDKERDKKFDSEFIELARSVYITNDQRFAIKAEVNSRYSSDVSEVKSYKPY